jgi:hypothetical protein
MKTIISLFYNILPVWIVFFLCLRVGITGWSRLLWCTVALVPVFGILALVRVAFFAWPYENEVKSVMDLPLSKDLEAVSVVIKRTDVIN